MTDMLEKAVDRAKRLPEKQQDAIAALTLEEIEDDARWDDSFARSHSVLETARFRKQLVALPEDAGPWATA